MESRSKYWDKGRGKPSSEHTVQMAETSSTQKPVSSSTKKQEEGKEEKKIIKCIWNQMYFYLRKWFKSIQNTNLSVAVLAGVVLCTWMCVCMCVCIHTYPWRRERQLTPVFLPGEFHGRRSLARCSPWGRKESRTTEWLIRTHTHTCIYTYITGDGLRKGRPVWN